MTVFKRCSNIFVGMTGLALLFMAFARMLMAAEPQFTLTTLTDGIADPWAIAALPNGDVLVTEKAGRLRIIRDGVLQDEAIAGTPEVRVGGQGGLMDLVLAPDFATSQW